MQTVREQAKMFDISPIGFNSTLPRNPDPQSQIKRLKIGEFKSWSVCFGLICALTGLLMYLKVGVTMESVTSALFFLSLAGLVYSIYKIIFLSKEPGRTDSNSLHELN
jgi:hypothetical protein